MADIMFFIILPMASFDDKLMPGMTLFTGKKNSLIALHWEK
jgi:hypothetical protein